MKLSSVINEVEQILFQCIVQLGLFQYVQRIISLFCIRCLLFLSREVEIVLK